jgi:FMN-dependent oxidoreductase (nitrilotriacetate monooxygenase family)
MSESTLIRLAADVSAVHTQGWLSGQWDGYDFYSPRWFEELARVAERGRLDMLFFGDSGGAKEIGGSYASGAIDGSGFVSHDRSALIAMMAKETSDLGFGMTMSTEYAHPFSVARYFASMNHALEGRIAWNAVTGAHKPEAANYGVDVMDEPERRYERAMEHLEVVRRLWDGIEPDALVMNREREVFLDPDKLHRIDFEGKHYKVRGPLPVLPAKGGHPVIISAGQSGPGMNLAASQADMQFVLRRSLQSMIDHRHVLDGLLDQHGRGHREVGVLWCIKIQLGDSRADAIARGEQAVDDLPPSTGINAMSSLYGVDLSRYAPDTPLVELLGPVQAAKGHWGMFQDLVNNAEPGTTLVRAARRFLFSPHDTMLGTPEDIADQIDELHQATGANGGVILRVNYTQPGWDQMRNFVDHVVPVLQRRGLTRREYTGASLRENLLS